MQAADDTPAAAVAALFVTIMKHFNTAAAEKPPKIVELQTNLLLCSCIFNSQIRPLLVLEPSWYLTHFQQGDGLLGILGTFNKEMALVLVLALSVIIQLQTSRRFVCSSRR